MFRLPGTSEHAENLFRLNFLDKLAASLLFDLFKSYLSLIDYYHLAPSCIKMPGAEKLKQFNTSPSFPLVRVLQYLKKNVIVAGIETNLAVAIRLIEKITKLRALPMLCCWLFLQRANPHVVKPMILFEKTPKNPDEL
jgi:hypothetical protein